MPSNNGFIVYGGFNIGRADCLQATPLKPRNTVSTLQSHPISAITLASEAQIQFLTSRPYKHTGENGNYRGYIYIYIYIDNGKENGNDRKPLTLNGYWGYMYGY